MNEELEAERERIKGLATALSSVIERAQELADAALDATGRMEKVKSSLETTASALNLSSKDVIEKVTMATLSMPRDVAGAVLIGIKPTVDEAVKDALKSINEAADRASKAAGELRTAVDAKVAKIVMSACCIAILAGAAAGAVTSIFVLNGVR